jgi:hypothetical protein
MRIIDLYRNSIVKALNLADDDIGCDVIGVVYGL